MFFSSGNGARLRASVFLYMLFLSSFSFINHLKVSDLLSFLFATRLWNSFSLWKIPMAKKNFGWSTSFSFYDRQLSICRQLVSKFGVELDCLFPTDFYDEIKWESDLCMGCLVHFLFFNRWSNRNGRQVLVICQFVSMNLVSLLLSRSRRFSSRKL